jgi:hypothetical protein
MPFFLISICQPFFRVVEAQSAPPPTPAPSPTPSPPPMMRWRMVAVSWRCREVSAFLPCRHVGPDDLILMRIGSGALTFPLGRLFWLMPAGRPVEPRGPLGPALGPLGPRGVPWAPWAPWACGVFGALGPRGLLGSLGLLGPRGPLGPLGPWGPWAAGLRAGWLLSNLLEGMSSLRAGRHSCMAARRWDVTVFARARRAFACEFSLLVCM